jgi:hypothetical protein
MTMNAVPFSSLMSKQSIAVVHLADTAWRHAFLIGLPVTSSGNGPIDDGLSDCILIHRDRLRTPSMLISPGGPWSGPTGCKSSPKPDNRRSVRPRRNM